MGETKPVSIGSLTKGNYVVIDGAACKVTDTQVSRPGKHGHAKVKLTGVGLIDGKKRVVTSPGHDHIDVPIIEKLNAQVLTVIAQGDKKIANVMDSETYETFDLEVPDELKDEVVDGVVVVYWEILDSKVIKQVKQDNS